MNLTEFSLDDSSDRLKTCRDVFLLMETEKRDSVVTVCLFQTAASCLYDPWVRNILTCDSARQLQLY
jgi:hypothetical protein